MRCSTHDFDSVTSVPIDIPLSFSQITCRCGTARITGQQCPYCGARPAVTEVDPEKQRRQKMARDARAEVHTNTQGFAAGLDELPALMKRLLDQFLLVASDLARQRGDGKHLADALHDIGRLRVTVESFRLRPQIGIATRFLVAVEEIEKAVAAVLDALCAEMPIAAQRLARLMQESINAAGNACVSANSLLKTWLALSRTDTTLISWIADAVEVLAPGQVLRRGYLDLDDVGSSLLANRIDAQCPRGLGICVAVLDFYSRLSFDESVFLKIVGEQLDFLNLHPARLETLASDDAWRTDWNRQAVSLWEIGERSRALFTFARSDDSYVWAGLAIAHDMEEGLAKQLLATLQLAAGIPGSYPETLAKGVANLAEWAVSRSIRAAGTFQSAIRNAHAHHDYRIEDDIVILTPLRPPVGGAPTYTAEEFGDALISVVEATMAMWLGTLLAMSKIGVSIDAVNFSQLVPVDAAASALMAAGGWHDVMFEVRGDVLAATASADRDPNMSEFVGLLPLIPSGIKVIVALLDCPSGTLRLVIPVDPLRRLRDASEEQAAIACAVLYGQISVNGDQLLRKEYLRKFFAIEALRRGALPTLADAMRKLREVRNACRELRDPELDAGIARLQTIRRTGAMGLAASNSGLGDIGTWAASQVVAGRWATMLSAGVLT